MTGGWRRAQRGRGSGASLVPTPALQLAVAPVANSLSPEVQRRQRALALPIAADRDTGRAGDVAMAAAYESDSRIRRRPISLRGPISHP